MTKNTASKTLSENFSDYALQEKTLSKVSKLTLTFTPTLAISINGHATQTKPFSQPHTTQLSQL